MGLIDEQGIQKWRMTIPSVQASAERVLVALVIVRQGEAIPNSSLGYPGRNVLPLGGLGWSHPESVPRKTRRSIDGK